ncbi:Panacea domain-containing protein [Clostridium cylindrosporum]|uniref:Putative phage-associated protein n=1 Tax=Clostridium cylindrosporum DSM 605 TaxID=1121307 RepID=A0A0J8D6X0_CLOCY|nr:type II toxin-antitoxin system antitoxin SocA domain-containing protein [Clostridium cylindrosporum]KMT21612.1 putative phage-associated protein [Clostridium cylindrosporum DSM 605]
MYSAIDVAKYTLEYCEKELNKPITNLQLQKLLYYMQGNSILANDKILFINDIQAWKYGPVVPDVYYWFNGYSSNCIKGIEKRDDMHFEECDLEVIRNVINKKIDIDPWKLVDDTHNELPWKENYIENMNCEIPITSLRENISLFEL